MSFSLISSTKGSGINGCTSGNIDTRNANLFILGAGWYNVATADVTPSDSQTVTWIPLTKKSQSGMANRIWYCISPVTNAVHNFSLSGNTTFPALVVEAWQATTTPAFYTENGADGGSAASLACGSVTPRYNGSLVAACLGHENNSSIAATINASFNKQEEVLYSSGANESGAIAHLVQGTAGAVNPTWSITNAALIDATIAVFEEAPTDASVSPFRPQRQSGNLANLRRRSKVGWTRRESGLYLREAA